ncbi:MAG: hypothetical protein FD123_3985 [Bacteroidetes bacterium]|nr:MAG: hypothetical protein FD123_3985 [Bacteroidota bacterium]
MRTSFLRRNLLLALAAGTLLTAAAFKAVDPEKVNITVKESKFSLGKKQVNLDWSVSLVKEYLGPQDRATESATTRAYVYDKAGLTVFENLDKEKKPTGKVNRLEMHLILGKASDDNPRTIFKGEMKLEGLEIVKELTPEKVRATFTAWTETTPLSSLTHCNFVKDGISIDFEFTGGGHQLRKVSIGTANN